MSDHYKDNMEEGRWQNYKRYQCLQCPFDSLDENVTRAHIDEVHPKFGPLPDVQVIRRDRFGNELPRELRGVVENPERPAPAKTEPAPPSKEVPPDFDPHRSHEERGLPIPKPNAAAKAAMKKAQAEGKPSRARAGGK